MVSETAKAVLWRRIGLLARQRQRCRVPVDAVHLQLVMQVWAGREARLADVADGLALLDLLPHLQIRSNARQMRVQRPVRVPVPEKDGFAIAAVPAERDDPALAVACTGVPIAAA